MNHIEKALRDLSDRQQWGRDNRVEVPGIPEAMERLSTAMIAEPDSAVEVLEACTDIDFMLAAQVFEDVAVVLGMPFVEKMESLAAIRPQVDIAEDIRWARDAAGQKPIG